MSDPVAVPMSQIVIDDRLQPRCDGLSDEHVASLMETPETWPPIVLARCNGGLFLIDGFHRHEAARRLGAGALMAAIYDPTEGTDLFSVAFRLNAKHGRPLTLRDRKAYALTLIRAFPDLADREIGRRTGLHHETVGALRAQRLRVIIPERRPGELPSDVGPLDRIRFGRKATREQKAIAGYIARLTIAMDDPYEEDSTLEVWPDDPAEIARACILAMGSERATDTLRSLDADARYILDVTKAARALLKEVAS
jgi:ParB-like chromosome segregation protein Spo0J